MKQLISGGREPPCTICTISICQIDLTLIFAISLMKVTFYLPIWQGLWKLVSKSGIMGRPDEDDDDDDDDDDRIWLGYKLI